MVFWVDQKEVLGSNSRVTEVRKEPEVKKTTKKDSLEEDRKRRVITQVPTPDLLKTMNVLIVPCWVSRLDASAPVGVV